MSAGAGGAAPAGIVTTPTFRYLSRTNDHDLVYGYIKASMVLGHPVELWLLHPLFDWLTEAEKELDRRGLRKKARARKKKLLAAYHAHIDETPMLRGYRDYRKWPGTGVPGEE